MIDIDEGRRLLKAATPGPYYVADDTAPDTTAHRNSGLALVDTGRYGDWPVARLCEWPTAAFIAWACNNAAALLAELADARRDAERYRWLRRDVFEYAHEDGEDWWQVYYGRIPFQESLDAAIDAARAALERKP